MKPGYKTTEFWLAVIAQIVPLLVMFGVFTAGEGEQAQNAMSEAVKAVFALGASAAPIWRYIQSREQVKIASKVAELPLEDLAR